MFRLDQAPWAMFLITLGDVFDRYAREVSPKKKGARWEQIRLEKFKRDPMAKIKLSVLRASDVADWRERRLRDVSPATVKREMTLMSAVFSVARREWELITINPMADVRKPSEPPPRDRRVSDDEIDSLLAVAGTDLKFISARVIHPFRAKVFRACWRNRHILPNP